MVFDIKSSDFITRPLVKRESVLKKTSQKSSFTSLAVDMEEPLLKDDVQASSLISTTVAMNYLTALNTGDSSSEKRGLSYGNDMLTALDTLKNQIIEGSVTKKTLEPLQKLLKHTDLDGFDPKLRRLVEDIRIRVEVELAKWEQDL